MRFSSWLGTLLLFLNASSVHGAKRAVIDRRLESNDLASSASLDR